MSDEKALLAAIWAHPHDDTVRLVYADCLVRANQKPESPVRTRPLSGISVGRTTSNVEMRSLATSSRRVSSSA